MSFFSMFLKSYADECREVMKLSYQKHYYLAVPGCAPMAVDRHRAALFGALGTRYIARGILPAYHEVVLWGELAPFLLMSKEVSIDAIVEYAVWQEEPLDAEETWLAKAINEALSSKSIIQDEVARSLAPIGFANNVRWCELLRPETRDMLASEAERLYQQDTDQF